MKYLKTELDFIHQILKNGGARYEDKLTIFDLYKKYVDNTIVTFDGSSCSSCGGSINRIWHQIKDFVLLNAHLFIN